MEKLKKIVELLDGRGQTLIRNTMEHESGDWFVHCWLEEINKSPIEAIPSHSLYTSEVTEIIHHEWAINLETSLDEIINKLEDNNHVK